MAEALMKMPRFGRDTLARDGLLLRPPFASLWVARAPDVVLICLVSREYNSKARVPAEGKQMLQLEHKIRFQRTLHSIQFMQRK